MGSRSALSQQQWFSLWFCCGSLIIKAGRSFILPVISKCWDYAFAASDTSLISWLSSQVNNERRILLRPAPTIRLRACLHGVGDPFLVGLVSFVFTLKTKETYPTRPGSPTPCKQGLREAGLSTPHVFKYWELMERDNRWRDNARMAHYVICEKKARKRSCWNCNIWPNWFSSHNHYITMASRRLWGNIWCYQ